MQKLVSEAIDLQIDVFQVSENSASLTLDLTSLDRVSLDLVVSSATGFWPKYVPDKPLFDYKFYISGGYLMKCSFYVIKMNYT